MPERRDLIAAPHAQRHRRQDLLKLAIVVGREEPERTPFARLQRRTPQAEQIALRRKLARPGGLACANVVDCLLRSAIRNVGGHSDEVFQDD
jgi:hypothetical protein